MIFIKEWSSFKNIISNLGVRIIHYEYQGNYYIYLVHGAVHLYCIVTIESTDGEDFLNNYLPLSNLGASDDDGDLLVRHKIAPRGWIYQAFCFDFEIGKYNSLYCKDVSGNNISGITYKIYDGSNAEITDSGAEGNAVKTVVTFEPAWDYCIVSGRIDQLSTATSDIRMWTIGVPDVPEAYGGSKAFVNGLNLKFVDDLVTEGRAPKRLNYSATYHTNKLQFTFKHDTSTAHRCMVIIDLYKA